jgi:uncharacterized protein (TIGR00369 family)
MIWQEPVRGGTPPPELWARPGCEQIQEMIDWNVGPPPIHYLTGMRPTAIGEGTCTFEGPASPWLAGTAGFILGGTLAILADGPLGCAIQSLLPPGTPYTTAELSMSFLRPAVADGRPLKATGRVVHAGKSLALSEVMVTDADAAT